MENDDLDNIIEATVDYKIVSADDVQGLQKAVKKIVYDEKNEFEPLGGPFVTLDGKVHQAMSRIEEIALDEEEQKESLKD